jgi:hypothetical protein
MNTNTEKLDALEIARDIAKILKLCAETLEGLSWTEESIDARYLALALEFRALHGAPQIAVDNAA